MGREAQAAKATDKATTQPACRWAEALLQTEPQPLLHEEQMVAPQAPALTPQRATRQHQLGIEAKGGRKLAGVGLPEGSGFLAQSAAGAEVGGGGAGRGGEVGPFSYTQPTLTRSTDA